jgi:metal-responsive CopG/Arc/MetJ family transcriptional regulator
MKYHTSETRKRERVTVSLDGAIIERIDSKRGLINRSRYVEELLKTGMEAPDGKQSA